MSRQLHARPELIIHADGVEFKYPPPRQRHADRIHSEVWGQFLGALFGLPLLASLGIGLAFFVAPFLALEPEARWALQIIGVLFVAAALLGALRTVYRLRHRDQLIRLELDRQATHLCVKERRLIRRYASGREEAWPRDRIEDVKVLTLTASAGDEANSIRTYCQLTLQLRDGANLPLYKKAFPGSFEAEDLHWMANELRMALQVPYDAPPVPVEGAVLERTKDGISIRLPHVEPESAWRSQWRTHAAAAVFLPALLGIMWGFGHVRAFFSDDVGSELWKDSVFFIVCMFILGAIFGSLALADYLRKASVMRDFADRTLLAVGVQPGTLYRAYASGRVESWRVADIAEVNVMPTGSKKTSTLGVFAQLKKGKPIHLYGKVDQAPRTKLAQEGLRWLSEELGKALGLLPEAPPPAPVDSTSEAIVDFAARARDQESGVRSAESRIKSNESRIRDRDYP
jgi:hypothetical protein